VKVLIIRPSALGDTLMLLPAIVSLKRPISIILAARSPGLHFLKPHVALALDFEGAGWQNLFAEEPNSLDSLRIPTAGRVIAFLKDPTGQLKRNLQARFPEAFVHLFPAFPPDEEQTHVALYVGHCLRAAGLRLDPAKSMQQASERALLGHRDQPFGRGPLVLHAGSGSVAKSHPVDFWLDVIQVLQDRMPDRPVTLLLGPAEEERFALCSERLRDTPIKIRICPESDELVTLLEAAAAYVGQDSGVTHLSALLGTPTIALFRNSSVLRWHPLGPCVKVIKREKTDPALLRDLVESVTSMLGDRME
jgi:ADP-heptose:LPS heptosyltransferase